MPIVEIYNCSKNISEKEYTEISEEISFLLNIDPSLVWIIQHSSIDVKIYKGKLYNQNAPIIFFNAREKYYRDSIVKCLKIVSENAQLFSNVSQNKYFVESEELLVMKYCSQCHEGDEYEKFT